MGEKDVALAANIVTCLGASLSLFSSSTIVYMIRRTPRGLKSSYSRIIFGLSIGDIIQSAAILIAVFGAPRTDTPGSPLALGTTLTCDLAGYAIILGILLTIFYLNFLIYYFWRRVKFRVTPENFANKEELYIHLTIWMLALVYPATVVSREEINPTRYRSTCIITSKPFLCGIGNEEDEDYMECTRGETATQMSRILCGIIGTLLLSLFAFLASITCHVYSIEKGLSAQNKNSIHNPSRNASLPNEPMEIVNQQQNLQSTVIDAENLFLENDEESELNQEEETPPANEEPASNKKDEKKESLTRRSLNQSLLYILAYVFTFAAPYAFFANPAILKKHYVLVLWLTALLVPTYGIFLILIYTRPKVKVLSEMFPESSWRLCFSVVVFSGGEVPPPNELKRPSPLPRMSDGRQEEENNSSADVYSYDNKSTNGVYYAGLRASMIAVSRSDGWYVQN